MTNNLKNYWNPRFNKERTYSLISWNHDLHTHAGHLCIYAEFPHENFHGMQMIQREQVAYYDIREVNQF